jgi:hypothetical protein
VRDRDDLAAHLDLHQEGLELLDRQVVERARHRVRHEPVARDSGVRRRRLQRELRLLGGVVEVRRQAERLGPHHRDGIVGLRATGLATRAQVGEDVERLARSIVAMLHVDEPVADRQAEPDGDRDRGRDPQNDHEPALAR